MLIKNRASRKDAYSFTNFHKFHNYKHISNIYINYNNINTRTFNHTLFRYYCIA